MQWGKAVTLEGVGRVTDSAPFLTLGLGLGLD